MSYIGNIPAENYASFLTETFSVSAKTNYTLSHAVSNENDIRLVINNVIQQPGSGKAYTASGTTLTLTSATSSGDIMYAVYLGRALQTVTPPNASVGTAQIIDSSVTSAKLASGVGGASLSGSTNNTVATVTGANALVGEANLTFDGTTLSVNGGAIFNESGADVDFRVESDDNANMIFLNANTNGVGIGKDPTADTALDVNGIAAISGELRVPTAIKSGSSNGTMTIMGGATYPGGQIKMTGGIASSDPGTIKFFTDDGSDASPQERMRIDSNGVLKFNTVAPIKNFDFSIPVTIADGAHIEFTSSSGVWFVTEQTQTGLPAILIAGGGQAAVASQIGSSYTNSAGSGTFRWFRQSGGGYRLKNDQGNSCNFGICHMSLRNGT